ncbi:MAG: AAA family ATPase, partial [Moorea sp. SIO2B7]|nr:AAA family ATPase [Moorena sp. SIO2B7]
MDLDSELLLDELYNAFDPFEPLPANDERYVDCKEVRGNEDILKIGRKIKRSRRNTCQLYAGHRGAGKSTELLRLKDYLEKYEFYVVYFAADEEDIDSEDAQYTDILLACTRHLLEELKNADSIPLRNWLKECWDDLKDLMMTKIELEGFSIETGEITGLFAKLTANLKAVPSERSKIRARVNPHTVNLIKALNQFIDNATKKLTDNNKKLAIIVDNLDRIAPITRENGRNNHDEIFLDRSEQLQGLNCSVIYTV